MIHEAGADDHGNDTPLQKFRPQYACCLVNWYAHAEYMERCTERIAVQRIRHPPVSGWGRIQSALHFPRG